MTAARRVFERAKLADGRLVDIAVASGRIVAVSSHGEGPAVQSGAAERIDLGGALVVPGFVEGHIHLDKGFIGDAWRPHRPYTAGFDVRERVAIEKELLATAAPIRQRAAALVELAVSHGTTHMRSHVDVDASVGLAHLDAILDIRASYREAISIEIVAFPQCGILTCPGTAELLEAAIASGADLAGGLDPAGVDRDVDGHLDVVFGVAERHGIGLDIHLHDPNVLGIFELERIAARTRALGMQGRVAVSHAYALGEVPLDVARRTAATLAEAGVAIMTTGPGTRAFPPVRALREAGVVVFGGNDNIRDAWSPYGDADLLERAMIVGYRSDFRTDEDLGIAFDLVTGSAAAALRLENYGLHAGAAADFVALAAAHVPEAVVSRPAKRSVYRAGRLVARDGAFLTHAGKAAEV